MELFREVGSSFEAVLCNVKLTTQEQYCEGGDTFSAKIADLERQKQKLTEALSQMETRAKQAKKDVDYLRSTINALRQENSRKMVLINSYKDSTVKCLEDANVAFQNFMLSGLVDGLDEI